MWIKIANSLIFLIIVYCVGCSCIDLEPTKDIKISKNITIYRNGHGRVLGLLSLLRGFHHAKQLQYPWIPARMSKLWRASFEFELKPSLESYFSSFPPLSNSGVGSNGIDSIFHFGNNQQQSSINIGEPNKITGYPDERDDVSTDTNMLALSNKDTPNSMTHLPTYQILEESERVLRHAISKKNYDLSREDEIDNPHFDDDDDESVDSRDELEPTRKVRETDAEGEGTETRTATEKSHEKYASNTTIGGNEHIPPATLPIDGIL